MEKKLRKESICVQAGWTPKNGEPRVLPIYQSTTFKYDDSDQMARLFDLKDTGYFYTRLQNPTNDAVASKIAQLEGGVGAMLTSSGQAANFYAVFNICEAGDHFVASNTIYGGTFNLFGVTMKKLGIECTFVDPDWDDERIEAAFRSVSSAKPSRTPAGTCSTLSASPPWRTATACPSSWTTPSPPPSTAAPSSGGPTL